MIYRQQVSQLCYMYHFKQVKETQNKNKSLRVRHPSSQERYLVDRFKLEQDPNCPIITDKIDDLFDGLGIGSSYSNWLQSNSTSKGFLEEMLELYIDTAMIGVTGAALGGPDSGPVCKRLPLNDTECYFVNNPDGSFFKKLVAKFIPFGDDIVKVLDEIEKIQYAVEDTVEAITELFAIEQEDPGLCFVINDDMVGIVEQPGFPSPFAYNLANCFLTVKGLPQLTVQPFFQGFAFATSNNALVYNVSDQLGKDFQFFDGFVEYQAVFVGDIW